MSTVILKAIKPKMEYEEIMPTSSHTITCGIERAVILESDSNDDSNAAFTESTSQGVSSRNAGRGLNSTLMQASTSFDTTNDETPCVLILSGRHLMTDGRPNELTFEKISSHLATEIVRKKKQLAKAQQTIRKQQKKMKFLQSKLADMMARRMLRRHSFDDTDSE